MRLRIISKILILLLFVGCTKEYSKISFREEIIDIGKVKPDTIIDVFFKPVNISNRTLRIERVTSDCHCTVARDYQKNIDPNKEGKIKVTYHSKGLGYFEQLIEVHSNAKNSPSILILKGKVVLQEK